MKKNYFLLLIAIISCNFLSYGQTKTLPYTQGAAATGSQYLSSGCETTINYLSTCQQAVAATFWSGSYGNNVWTDGNYEYYVNGVLRGTGTGTKAVDLTEFMPITSIRIKKTNYANWNQVSIVANVTSLESSMPVPAPTVSNVSYGKNVAAAPLTATPNGTGTTLKWYTSAQGENYSATAPTPSTATEGTSSYWVAQINADGCESERIEIKVVVDSALATSTFDMQNAIKLYPNPTSDNINIELPNSNAQLDVFDISGRLVLSKDLQSAMNLVNISALTPGVYMFRISGENGSAVKQVLKK